MIMEMFLTSEAGKAVTDGIFYPKYDDDAAIYDDLYKEFKEAIAALNPAGDFVSAGSFLWNKCSALNQNSKCCRPGSKVEKIG